jgi:hypothetical protein
MILNELFENRLSDIHAAYQDYLRIGKSDQRRDEFTTAWGMTPDTWARRHQNEINKLTAHQRPKPVGDEHLFRGSAVPHTVHEGAMSELHAELSEKYRELAPKIEKYKDSYLAGQLYDALEAIAIEHDAEHEFKRMMTGARNRAHMDYDTNPGGFQNWFWYLPFADDEQLDEISKTTLASYVKKAAPDRYNRIPNDLMQMKDAEKNRRQWVTRDKGIAQALDKLSKEGVTEENQDDRNARILAGEIEDAISQGNQDVAKQKLKNLLKLGYYLDAQGKLHPMGMYEEVMENLRKWFKEKWVRFGPDGKIRGDCARGSNTEGKPKCLPQSKAHALGKKGRASAAAKKRREDPNPERRGPAKNVATKVKEENQDDRNARIIAGEIEDAAAQGNEQLVKQKIKQLIGVGYTLNKDGQLQRMGMYEGIFGFSEEEIQEEQDACYRKVKSRYKVWPSAYASGALVQCRKKGAANWGNKGSKKK